MKISLVPFILLLIATVAISYLAYYVAYVGSDPNDLIVGAGSFVSVLLTLGCVFGFNLENRRMNANLRAWGVVSFLMMIVVNFLFAWLGVGMPYYIILLALLMVIHLWVVWKLTTTETA